MRSHSCSYILPASDCDRVVSTLVLRFNIRRQTTYGVIGIELRIREPSASACDAPLRFEDLSIVFCDEEDAGCRGVLWTSLRNWSLFMSVHLFECTLPNPKVLWKTEAVV